MIDKRSKEELIDELDKLKIILEVNEEKHVREKDFLSQAALEFEELSSDSNIYEFIAKKLAKFVENSIVAVNTYYELSDSFYVRAVSGKFKRLNEFSQKILGLNLLDIKVPAKNFNQSMHDETREKLYSGKIIRIDEAIYHIFNLPRKAAKIAKITLNIGDIYAAAFKWDGKIYGTVNIFMKKDNKLENKDTIETFVRLASVALQRRKAEDALKESERKYRNIFENVQDVFYQTDVKGKITEISPSIERYSGFSRDYLIGRQVETVYKDPEDRKKMLELIQEKGEVNDYEVVLKNKLGSTVYASTNAHFLLDSHNQPIGIEGSLRDISQRKKAEEALMLESAKDQALAKIYSPLISPGKTLQDISLIISNESLALTGSEHGFVATIDPTNQDLVNHTLTRMMSQCDVYDDGKTPKEIRFPINPDGKYAGLWGHCLNIKEAFYTNNARKHPSAKGVPDGHVPIEKFLAVPVLIGKELVGEIALANPLNKDYSDEDIESTEKIAEFSALAIQRKRYEDKISESLDEKEMLLKEIHHRVKNNLMIISSLLSLQSQYIKDKESQEIFRESENRTNTMALIHERLYQSTDLKNIDFGDYIRSLTSDLYHSIVPDPSRVKLNIDVEDLKIDINTVVPLGLIVNELVTNSMKYAFPGQESGYVNVELYRENEKIVLKVSDNGIGFPKDFDYKKTSSLGLQLVNSLVRQIDGELELEKNQGTTFTIIFKEQKE